MLTDAPLSDWFGIYTELKEPGNGANGRDSGRVVALDLSSNNLYGWLPFILGKLEQLEFVHSRATT